MVFNGSPVLSLFPEHSDGETVEGGDDATGTILDSTCVVM